MDPVSGVASIFAVIQIADRVVSLCKFYIGLARDAPSDLRLILIETSALKTILDNISFLTSNGHSPAILDTLAGSDGPIEGCRKALDRLSGLLPPEHVHVPDPSGNRSKRRKLKATLATLAWPLKESMARKLLEEVKQHKATLNLALTADMSHDIKDIKSKASEIQATLTEFERQEIYKWLGDIDPSSLHQRACSQYESGTGDWVLRSKDWKAWLSGQTRALWIHGIPGAGKTVLTSHLIETIKTYCDTDGGYSAKGKMAYVYYYCYYGHDADEASAFLKWTVRQLARRANVVPDKLHKLYKRGEGPNLADLLGVLEELVKEFDCVYIILDAIDESMPRLDLLKVLRGLVTDPRFEKMRILATSREYIDIETSMKSISTPISMRNPLLDEDIRLYVQVQLMKHPKLSLWPPLVQADALEALATKAKGMFRWVVCQIHILQRLKPNRHTILKALANLPRTLDETYERIFLQVPAEDRPLVHHTLKWIYTHNELRGGNIPATNLIQALQRSTSGLDSTENNYDYDEDLLRESCGCLISLSLSLSHHTQEVSFAHYTVLEFLESPRIRKGPASYFAIDRVTAKLDFAEMVLREALNTKEDKLLESNEFDYDDEVYETRIVTAVENDFNLYSIVSSIFAVHDWGPLLSQHARLCKLTFDLFDAAKRHFEYFEDAVACLGAAFDEGDVFGWLTSFWGIRWDQPPTNTDVRTLINILLVDKSGEIGRSFIQGIHEENWLHSNFVLTVDVWKGDRAQQTTACHFEGTVVELFSLLTWEHSAGLKILLELAVGYFDPSRILWLSARFHSHTSWIDTCKGNCFVDRLLQLGADPDGHGYRVCPLQLAAAVGDPEGARLLLEAGADPNNTGDQGGVMWKYNATSHRYTSADLLNRSPLNIVQYFWNTWGDTFEIEIHEVAQARQKLRALLSQYGGEDFKRSEVESPRPTLELPVLEELA